MKIPGFQEEVSTSCYTGGTNTYKGKSISRTKLSILGLKQQQMCPKIQRYWADIKRVFFKTRWSSYSNYLNSQQCNSIHEIHALRLWRTDRILPTPVSEETPISNFLQRHGHDIYSGVIDFSSNTSFNIIDTFWRWCQVINKDVSGVTYFGSTMYPGNIGLADQCFHPLSKY